MKYHSLLVQSSKPHILPANQVTQPVGFPSLDNPNLLVVCHPIFDGQNMEKKPNLGKQQLFFSNSTCFMFNVNPGLINHGLLIRGYSSNSHSLIILTWYPPN